MQQVWLMDTNLHSLVVVLVTLWHIFWRNAIKYEKLISRPQKGIVAVVSFGRGSSQGQLPDLIN
jgi:hypothetical protein